MDLDLLPVAPYITKLKRSARGQGYPGPFAVNAVMYPYARHRHKTVHLTVLCHLDLALSAPYCP